MGKGETIDLFDDGSATSKSNRRNVLESLSVARRARQKPQKTRVRATPDASFSLEDHVCRVCFARLVSEAVGGKRRRYLCTNCGAEASGTTPDVLCACGLRLRASGSGDGTVDAGLRCQPNPKPTPEFPSLVVAGPLPS